MWVSDGKPPSGKLYDHRKFARYKYHWAIKKVKKERDAIIRSKTAEQLNKKSFNKFWDTIKKLNSSDKSVSKVVDDLVSSKDISNHFRNIYENLYNSVEDNHFDSQKDVVDNLINLKCKQDLCSQSHCHNITSEILQKAINNLATDKDD